MPALRPTSGPVDLSRLEARRPRSNDPPIAVVTGGNKGIGFEICRQLARKGVNVVLTARDKSKGLAATGQLQAQGLNVIFHPLEVTDAAAVQRLARYLDTTHGRCDILVNNAGIALDRYNSMSVLDTPLQLFRDTLETNVYGPLMLVPGAGAADAARALRAGGEPVQRHGSARGHGGWQRGLPHVEDSAQCAHPHGRCSHGEKGYSGKCPVPGVGAYRYGWAARRTRGREGGGDGDLVGDAARERPDRRVVPRQEGDCLVGRGTR